MEAKQAGMLREMMSLAKLVFIQWERMRFFYNLALAIILYFTLRHMSIPLETLKGRPDIWGDWVLCGVAANLCYFGGPLADLYLTWLGYKERAVTLGLFALGRGPVDSARHAGGVHNRGPCLTPRPAAFKALIKSASRMPEHAAGDHCNFRDGSVGGGFLHVDLSARELHDAV